MNGSDEEAPVPESNTTPKKRCIKCGRFGNTKWKKCWDCRKLEGYDSLKESQDFLRRRCDTLSGEVSELRERLKGGGQTIRLQVKYSSFNCTEEYLKTLLKAIEPVAEIIQIDYNQNTNAIKKGKWPMSFAVKRKGFTMTSKRLQELLVCVVPVSDSVFLEWERRKE